MDERDLVEHAGFLRNLARHLLSDEHLAQDALQDARVAALQARGVRDVRPWLAAVTRNLALRILRREAGRRGAERAAARREELPSAHELAAQAETHRRVAQAVLELEEPYRSTILLRFFHHKTPSQIARHRGEPVATVKTRLRRALQLLRGRLDAEHGSDGRAWVLALLPLSGRPGTRLISTGGLAVLKTKALAAAVALTILATLLVAVAWRGGARGGASVRAPRAEVLTGPEQGETATARPSPSGSAARTAAMSIEPVSAEERRDYEEWRNLAAVLRQAHDTREEARKLLAELGRPEDAPVPVPDPATKAYLAELIRQYRSLGPGEERLALLGRLLATHAKYLEATGDTGFLSFLEEVVEGSSVADERELAVPDGEYPGTLDLLLRLLTHADPKVRAGVLRSLADVPGASRPRARSAIVQGLEDDASAVRWTAALQLEYAVADPAHTAALLARIGRETHPLAMDAMVKAVLALRPGDGVHRVAAAVRDAPRAIRALALDATGRPEVEQAPKPAFAERQAGAGRPEPKEDTVARDYLTQLFEEYRALPAGAERLAVLGRLSKSHAGYLERTGDGRFLPALADLARSSPVAERLVVVRSLQGTSDARAVDLLIECKADPDPSVRGAVASRLTWVRGREVKRAHEHLLQLLDDPAPSVRRITASLIAVPLGDATRVPLLLSRLSKETDLMAAYAMIDAIVRLDPDRGRSRIDSVLQAAPARAATQAALKLHDQRAR